MSHVNRDRFHDLQEDQDWPYESRQQDRDRESRARRIGKNYNIFNFNHVFQSNMNYNGITVLNGENISPSRPSTPETTPGIEQIKVPFLLPARIFKSRPWRSLTPLGLLSFSCSLLFSVASAAVVACAILASVAAIVVVSVAAAIKYGPGAYSFNNTNCSEPAII